VDFAVTGGGVSLVLYYDLPLTPQLLDIRLKKTFHVSKGETAWLTNQKLALPLSN
jgi:hypothetical protein